MLQNLDMQKESLAVPAAPQDLEPRLVYIGDIRFEIGETSLAGDTPRGTFLYVPIIGGIFLLRRLNIVPLELTFSSSLQVILTPSFHYPRALVSGPVPPKVYVRRFFKGVATTL